MKNSLKLFIVSALMLSLYSCDCANSNKNSNDQNTEQMKYTKKFTNADFYTDGKFNQDVAINAYKDMLKAYDVPFTALMEKDFWVTDFGLGDFENVGMGGIFWVNDAEHGYFAHEIYLLPCQMIPEHAHVKTDKPAKFESWMIQKGMCYNYSAVGEPNQGGPKIPESHGPITSTNFEEQEVGELLHLKEIETFHFLVSGEEGAIVSEWASYHDNAGLRFTNAIAHL